MRRNRAPIGARPGTLAIPGDSPPPRIHAFGYSAESWHESDLDSPAEIAAIRSESQTVWVEVQGLGSESVLREIAAEFQLHPLALEAATNIPQRARHEVNERYLLSIARVPARDDDGNLSMPQVCMILGDGWLLTFQDRYLGLFDGVRERIREGLGPIRTAGPSYLFVALLDAMADHYFPVAEDLAALLEDLEDSVNVDPQPAALREVHAARRDLVALRRVGQPQVDAHRALSLRPEPFIEGEAIVYLRSAEQHVAQAMGIIESAREHASSLVELYLSNVSHKTNEVMKVLTLMASIFIPLTFVAGIYGMNFEWMPELKQPWGYPAALSVMAAVAAAMTWWFRARGWVGTYKPRDGDR